ncbi:MAG: LytTR family DNA-binding domain-containing protein [Longimicrobiales bacterium]|nr:LytTR family DNA-binding domain-containing protein [Longimicrobiales bacterium]
MAETDELGRVRVVVCEDEPLARDAMVAYLADVSWVEIVATAEDGREALRLIHKHEPDLVFLDVRMPGLSGLEVLEALRHRPAVVFTTAFDEYAIGAFEHGAVDYLVKPFGRDRLVQTLDRVRVRLVGEARARRAEVRARRARSDAKERAERADGGEGWVERIFARHGSAIVPVRVGEIRHLEAVDGGVELHTADRALHVASTLGEVESRLDPGDFVRVHRSHVINLAHVASIRRYDDRRLQIRLDDGTKILASRAGSKALREMIE